MIRLNGMPLAYMLLCSLIETALYALILRMRRLLKTKFSLLYHV
jgi:hypothetical protein